MNLEDLPQEFQETVKVADALQDPASQQAPVDLLEQALNYYAETTPPITNEDGSSTPSLPPALAAVRGKTGDEMLKDLNTLPLFMTDLEENDGLEALKALAYEGTPLEVGAGFKERGNECWVEKNYKDAKEFYSKAINVLLIEVRTRQKAGNAQKAAEDKEEVKKEIAVLEACLVNRAACHLELKNYRSCTLDCGSALRINPKNVKAYYRSSKALLALDKIAEADDACARGLGIDSENKALQGIAKEIIKKNDIVLARKKKEFEREQRQRLEVLTLRAALKARGIKTRKTAQPPEMEDAKIQLVPDPVDPTSTITFPAVLLYPLHLESDFIKAFNETEPLGHHLDYILPVPWDQIGEYTPTGVECYMETLSGGLVKLGRKVTLLKALSTGNIEVLDEVVKIFVLPKAKAAAWIVDFKAKKAVEKATAAGA